MPFLKWVGGFVLEYVLGKLFSFLKKLISFHKKNKEIKKEAEESVKPLKDAVTAEEIDSATDSALDKF